MLCIAFGIVMVLSLCAQSQSSAVDGLSLHVNGKFDELVHEVDHLKEVLEGMKQCHVDVNVIADEDAHSQGDHAVDINLHVKEDHHDDEHDDDDHEEVHDDNDYYGNVYCKACADTHHTMHGVIHMEHLKEYEHLEFVVVVHDAQPNTEYTVKVYDHGHKDGHCDFRASELFDPENPADHKGELGKFTTDGQGHAHEYIKDTHSSLRGGHGNSIFGHIVSIDAPAHTYECHGVAGHSTKKEVYHEFVQHHREKEFDFDHDDVYAVCHLHSGEHDGHVTGVRGDVHFAQHSRGDYDMQIRVDITGAIPYTHYTVVEYVHGDTGHKCIDMGEKYDTVHHEKHDYGFTTDVNGAGHAIFYNANNTLLSHSSGDNVAGYAFAINDDAGHHEACCVAGITTYDEEHHHFRHEAAHYGINDYFATAHMRVHESDFASEVKGEVHIMQHIKSKFYNDSQLTISVSRSPKNRIEYVLICHGSATRYRSEMEMQESEPNKAEVRIDLEHLRGLNYERLQLYIDDHEHAAKIHDCPHFTDLDEGGMSQYVGDFHTEQGHEVEHYGFLDVPIALKGDHSIIGSVIAVYDGTDDAHHALVCGIIKESDYNEEEHYMTAHAKDDVHYI